GEQAVTQAHFLSRTGRVERGDVAFFGNQFGTADVIGVDAEEFLGFRVGVDLALTENAVDALTIIEGPACIDAVTGSAHHTLGLASDDIRPALELLDVVNDAVTQQEAVDRFQRNGRNGFGQRGAAYFRRQLDGAA